MKYSVLMWCSDPAQENDDLDSVKDFDSPEEAVKFFSGTFPQHIEYVEIEIIDSQLSIMGIEVEIDLEEVLGIECIRKNPNFSPSKDDFSDEKRETAMQAGMAGGCEAFNDIMGW